MNADLIIDDEVRAPGGVNRQLASVSLRAVSNSFDDGYDVAISAFTTPEQLTLEIGDSELEVLCEIKQFELDFTFSRSGAEFGRDYARLVESSDWRLTEQFERTDSRVRKSANKASAGANVGIDTSKPIMPSATASLDGEKTSSQSEEYSTSISGTRAYSAYSHVTIDCINVGDHRAERPLSGMVVSDYVGLSLTPKTKTQRSGVLARFRVKRNWIKMQNPRLRSPIGEVGRKLSAMFGRESDEDKLRAAAFPVLLEKLVHLRLQEEAEKEYATLAADCVVVKPNSQDIYRQLQHSNMPRLNLDLAIVESFLNLPANQIPEFMEEIEAIEHLEKPAKREPETVYTAEIEQDDSVGVDVASSYGKPHIGFPKSSPEFLVDLLQDLEKKTDDAFEGETFPIPQELLPVLEGGSAYDDLLAIGAGYARGDKVLCVTIPIHEDVPQHLAMSALSVARIKRTYEYYKEVVNKDVEATFVSDLVQIAVGDGAGLVEDSGSLAKHVLEWCMFIDQHAE